MARTELTGKQIKDHSVDLVDDTTGVLPVANGGTGSETLPINNVLLGNGLGALQTVAPSTAGYVLTSNGTTWIAAAATGNVISVNDQDGAVVITAASIGAEETANKGEPDGYASLDGSGKIPLMQLPSGVGVDSLVIFSDTIQLYSGDTPVGDPVSLIVTSIDGGIPGDSGNSYIDGGSPGNPDVTAWGTLQGRPAVVAAGATAADARSIIDAEFTGNKGQPSGYASLDSSGLVPQDQLPITPADWTTLEGKPAVVAAGATKADARTAIDAEDATTKGQPGGYASLDSNGLVPVAQWGFQVIDCGTASVSTADVIDGGTA